VLRGPVVLVLDVFLYDRQLGEHGGTSMGESGLRDVGRLAVLATGAVVAAPGDRVLPVRLTGADGAEVAAVTGFLLAAVYGIALLASGRATRKHQIPFGPFMIAGAFLVILAWHSAGA
jgi:hypothetical protein